MLAVRRRRLKVASVRRRLAALGIDFVVLGFPFVAACLGIAGAYTWYSHRRGRELEDLPRLTLARRWRFAIGLASIAMEVPTRNWRSPGYRAMRLRCVDARTGGPVTARSIVIRWAFGRSWSWAAQRLMAPWQKQNLERLGAVQSEVASAVAAVREAHGDERAAQRVRMDVYKRHDVKPSRTCLAPVLPAVALQIPAVWSPRRQSLPDRLAGIMVVVED